MTPWPGKPAIAETRLALESEILSKADCILATSPQEKKRSVICFPRQGE